MASMSRSPTRRATKSRVTASPAAGSWCAAPGSSAATTAKDKPLLEDGWFNTGDLATIDGDNYIQLTDRAKDVIKSGGEWISSIDVGESGDGLSGRGRSRGDRHSPSEMGGAAAAGCCARCRCGRPHRSIAAHLEGKIAKWWMPGRCRVRRSAELRRNRQNPEDGVAPPLRRVTMRRLDRGQP